MPSMNDNFSDAIEVVIPSDGATYTSDALANNGNTTEPNEPSGTDALSMWWKYTPASSGVVTFDTQLSTANPSRDTYMSVFTGSALDNLVRVATDDDGGGSGTSRIPDLSVTSGTTYWIQVGGYGFSTINVVLRAVGPASTGSGGSGVSLNGGLATYALSALTGAVSTSAPVVLVGPVVTYGMAAPVGAVSTAASVALTGSAVLLGLSAPSGAVATSDSLSVALTAPPAHASLTTPAGGVSAQGAASVSGALATFSLSALPGIVDAAGNARLTGSTVALALTSPAGSVSIDVRPVAQVATFALSAPAGTFRFSDALTIEDALVRLYVPISRRSFVALKTVREMKARRLARILEEE